MASSAPKNNANHWQDVQQTNHTLCNACQELILCNSSHLTTFAPNVVQLYLLWERGHFITDTRDVVKESKPTTLQSSYRKDKTLFPVRLISVYVLWQLFRTCSSGVVKVLFCSCSRGWQAAFHDAKSWKHQLMYTLSDGLRYTVSDVPWGFWVLRYKTKLTFF